MNVQTCRFAKGQGDIKWMDRQADRVTQGRQTNNSKRWWRDMQGMKAAGTAKGSEASSQESSRGTVWQTGGEASKDHGEHQKNQRQVFSLTERRIRRSRGTQWHEWQMKRIHRKESRGTWKAWRGRQKNKQRSIKRIIRRTETQSHGGAHHWHGLTGDRKHDKNVIIEALKECQWKTEAEETWHGSSGRQAGTLSGSSREAEISRECTQRR